MKAFISPFLYLFLLGIFSLSAYSCGPDCRSSCERAYGDGPGECAIVRVPGDSAEKNINKCFAACESDMENLLTEEDRIVWMNCIMDVNCEPCSNPETKECEEARSLIDFCFTELGEWY